MRSIAWRDDGLVCICTGMTYMSMRKEFNVSRVKKGRMGHFCVIS